MAAGLRCWSSARRKSSAPAAACVAIDRMDNDPVLVVNGDLYHDIDLEQVYHHHLRSGFDVTMALRRCPRFNTVQVADGRVLGFDGARASGSPSPAST